MLFFIFYFLLLISFVVFVAQLLSRFRLFCSPMDCSRSGSSVHGISQERILEWVAISFLGGILSTQQANLNFLHYRQTFYRWTIFHLLYDKTPKHSGTSQNGWEKFQPSTGTTEVVLKTQLLFIKIGPYSVIGSSTISVLHKDLVFTSHVLIVLVPHCLCVCVHQFMFKLLNHLVSSSGISVTNLASEHQQQFLNNSNLHINLPFIKYFHIDDLARFLRESSEVEKDS